MKKFCIISVLLLFSFCLLSALTYANIPFAKAIRTCETYSLDGSAKYEGQYFNVLVTLQKKGDKCVYKEKIYQDKKYQLLTCNFDKSQLAPIADLMEKYANTYKSEIAKQPIFEAKMTSNRQVFNGFIAKPNYCNITYSKQKL